MTKRLSLPDPILFFLALATTIVGLFLIFDAGYARSIASGDGPIPREFKMQVLFAVASLGIGLLCARIPIDLWKRLAVPGFGLCVALLLAVKVIGVEMNGAKRWLDLGPFNLQPSEFAKFGVIAYLAFVFCQRKPWVERTKRFKHWAQWLDAVAVPKMVRAWPALLVLFVVVMIEFEPDLGTAAVVAAVAYAMFWLGGVSWKSMLAITIIGLSGVAALTIKEPYRVDRILNHSQRWQPDHVDDVGYQTTQSEAAMASGRLLGVGIGSGRAKHIMPAATTDFIMATVGEEFGLLGSLTVIGLLAALTLRLIILARRSPSRFGQLILLGTAAWFGIQSCTNILMANGTVPPIGIPIPFISSGGSSLIALWIALGVCQAAAVPKLKMEEAHETGRDRWGDRRSRLSRA